jgi:hypothetical protein
MPLKAGKSKRVVAANIRELRRAGKPHKQSVAIAMSQAGMAKKAKKNKKRGK